MIKKITVLSLFLIMSYGTAQATLIGSYNLRTNDEGFISDKGATHDPSDLDLSYGLFFGNLYGHGHGGHFGPLVLPVDTNATFHVEDLDSIKYQRTLDYIANYSETWVTLNFENLTGWCRVTLETIMVRDMRNYALTDIVITGFSELYNGIWRYIR